MRELSLAALGAYGASGCVDTIVAAATSMSACAAFTLLRYSHDLFSFFITRHALVPGHLLINTRKSILAKLHLLFKGIF